MKITRISFWTVDMALKTPYTIAYESVEQVSNVFLRVYTDSGITGF